MFANEFLNRKLDERKNQNAFRELKISEANVDFCSNDYLGIVKNGLAEEAIKDYHFKHGSTGSRLLSGNYKFIEDVEKRIAAFHDAEAALIFNSGYDANVGLMASVAQKGDTIIFDQLVHASIRDGIRLSFANSFSFLHNDTADLEKKLQQSKGNIFVVTESVFSMDGDICPLTEIIRVCNRAKANVIIDEAHAIGVIGDRGEGYSQHMELHNQCFARVYAYGKACGCHGAAIVGSALLKSYLINFARSFIYTTALPAISVAAIDIAYQVLPTMNRERVCLRELIGLFQSADLNFEKLTSNTPVQAVVVPGNAQVRKLAVTLQENDFDIRPILYPTVPIGKERLRIVLHAFNHKGSLEKVISILNS